METRILELLSKAHAAMSNAYVPSCNFPVGACLSTKNGTLFTGCNFENSSLSLSVCAETSAICTMITAGYKDIKEIAIVAKHKRICPPCGGCLQRIAEFSSPETKIYLGNSDRAIKIMTLKELLPLIFSLNN